MVSNRSKAKQTVLKRPEQLEYIQRVVLRSIWRNPKSWPFREPVDPIRHNASDYFDVIKQPMDFGTIRTKLLNNQYEDADQCIADFRLVFENCYKYNSEGLPIYDMCTSLEELFNEKITGLPASNSIVETTEDIKSDDETFTTESSMHELEDPEAVTTALKESNVELVEEVVEVKPVKQKKAEKKVVKDSPKVSIKKKKSVDDLEDLYLANKAEEADLGIKRDSRRNLLQSLLEFEGADSLPNSSPSIRYCYMIVKELFSRKHSDYAWPYYEPVDTKAPSLADYPTIIHYPTDLSSIKIKLEHGMYGSAFECVSEIRRMISNSFRYNPEGHAIHEMGRKLAYALNSFITKAPTEIFDSLIFYTGVSYNFLPTNVIENLEKQIQKVVTELTDAKSRRVKRKSKSQKTEVAINDKEDYVNPITAKTQPSANAFLEVEHSEPMTYEEKRKLSMDINRLSTDKLGDVLGLICQLESSIVADKNSSEVEIDFDLMKPYTLRKLENFLKFLNKPSKQKRKRPLTKVNGHVVKPTNSNGYVDCPEVNSVGEVVGSLPISECSTPQDMSELENIDFSVKKEENFEFSTNAFNDSNLMKTVTLDDFLIPDSMLTLSKTQSDFKDVSEAVKEVKNQKKQNLEGADESNSCKDFETNEISHSPQEIEIMKKEQQEKRLALANKTRAITAQSDLMAPYNANL